MKVYITFLFCLFQITIFCQDKLPAFGKIDKADLLVSTCSFDSDATAMYLIDRGEVTYDYGLGSVNTETDHWERIKILRETGINYANIKINYYSKDGAEEISKVEAYVFNLDSSTGNIVTTKVEKAAFYDSRLNDNYSTVAIAFPNVKVGSVIEYRYQSYRKRNIEIKNWIFQKRIPSRYSEYTVYFPNSFEFTTLITRRQPMENNLNDSRHVYIMRNIPALKPEPYMANFNDYLQRVDFQLSGITQNGIHTDIFGTWGKITDDWLGRDIFGGQLKKNIPNTQDLDTLLQPLKSELERMNTVYRYVQKNMESDGNRTYWSPNGVQSAWEKKRGTVGDINLLLINLLLKAGVNVYPIWASTKEHGHVNIAYPSVAQFNEVLAYVPIGGKEYVLNAADKYSPYNLMPHDVQSTRCFVLDKDKSLGWIILNDGSQKLQNSVVLNANMDVTGKVSGEAVVNSYGYARSIHLASYKKGNIKSRFNHEGIKAEKVTVTGADEDTLPLKQKVIFTGNLEKTGDYYFLPYNLFSGMATKNLFTANERQSDIDFNYLQAYSIIGSYTIPEDFTFEELPKNTHLILADSSISVKRTMESTGNKVTFNLRIDYNRQQYFAQEYPDIKEFYKKMFSLLNEKIVVKKK